MTGDGLYERGAMHRGECTSMHLPQSVLTQLRSESATHNMKDTVETTVKEGPTSILTISTSIASLQAWTNKLWLAVERIEDIIKQ
jgi:hypothetical protein